MFHLYVASKLSKYTRLFTNLVHHYHHDFVFYGLLLFDGIIYTRIDNGDGGGVKVGYQCWLIIIRR